MNVDLIAMVSEFLPVGSLVVVEANTVSIQIPDEHGSPGKSLTEFCRKYVDTLIALIARAGEYLVTLRCDGFSYPTFDAREYIRLISLPLLRPVSV